MVPNVKGWNYLVVNKSSTLLKRITSKHVGDFNCLDCLYLFRTKKLEFHKKVGGNKYFSGV